MTKRLCGTCAYFADEADGSSPYCLIKDLYTDVKADDEACDAYR